MQDEGLLCSNTDNQFGGPSCYGYVSDLPADKTEDVKLKDLWTWSESQETEMMSPKMFAEFFLPAMAELANMFGMTYYGCCERLDHKIDYVLDSIKNVRIFSISGWTHVDEMMEKMGDKYVASKKPIPAIATNAEWDAVKKEADQTYAAAKRNNTPVEIICRDVYAKTCTPERAIEWVRIWKETFGIA
jgi:hypothetical protein